MRDSPGAVTSAKRAHREREGIHRWHGIHRDYGPGRSGEVHLLPYANSTELKNRGLRKPDHTPNSIAMRLPGHRHPINDVIGEQGDALGCGLRRERGNRHIEGEPASDELLDLVGRPRKENAPTD